jgi:hypothetical protein
MPDPVKLSLRISTTSSKEWHKMPTLAAMNTQWVVDTPIMAREVSLITLFAYRNYALI